MILEAIYYFQSVPSTYLLIDMVWYLNFVIFYTSVHTSLVNDEDWKIFTEIPCDNVINATLIILDFNTEIDYNE